MLVKEKIIRIISILFITGCVLFFGGRGVYYVLDNRGITLFKSKKEYTLTDKLISTAKGSSNNEAGLVMTQDAEYYYIGPVKDNYLLYASQLWRILSIDADLNLTLALETPITALNYNGLAEVNAVMQWLNDQDEGVFMAVIANEEALLKNRFCDDDIPQSKLESGKYVCSQRNANYRVGLLDVTQYINAGGKDSFLNNGYNYWLANRADKENYWFVSAEGSLNYENSATKIFGVKPTIVIKGNQILLEGLGTADKPYVIEKLEPKTLSAANPGDYILFSDSLWRIVEINATGVKVVTDGYMDTKTYSYATKESGFNPSDKQSLAYYLNTEFYKSLSAKDLVVEGLWYFGSYNTDTAYDYRKIKENSVKAKVGLLNIGDLYILDWPSAYTMTPEFSLIKLHTIYTISDKYGFFADIPSNQHKVRPALYLNPDTKIEEGQGTKVFPYLIGGSNGE